DAAGARVERARSERWPDLYVLGGVQLGHDAYASGVVVGVGIELPVFDFGEGPVAAARAETIAAQANLVAVRRESEAAVEAARADLRRRQAALEAYDAAVLGQVAELGRMSEAAYRGGQVTLLDL